MNYPNISARAIINTLAYKLKEQTEREIWRDYMARGMRILTANTANFAGGSALTMDFSDIIDPGRNNSNEPKSDIEPGEATKSIRNKFKMNGD